MCTSLDVVAAAGVALLANCIRLISFSPLAHHLLKKTFVFSVRLMGFATVLVARLEYK